MLRVENLCLSFLRYEGLVRRSQLPCLTGLSLDVQAGEVVAVVGASGAGKSLLAHAVVGILPAHARLGGRILYKDEPLDAARQERLRGREIALVPQSVAYLDPLARVGRQVVWAAQRAGMDASGAREAARRSLAAYDLDETVLERFPHELSGGMARRVLLAIATIADAHLIIADEPTSGLDEKNVRNAMAHLRALADRGKGVMVITHDIPAALAVADRVAVIRNGRTHEIAAAAAFDGQGGALTTKYARRLWNALPGNDFQAEAA
jgi:peptide/nickel transport system ATP-binding protein